MTGGKNGWSRKDGSLTSSIKEKGEIASSAKGMPPRNDKKKQGSQ